VAGHFQEHGSTILRACKAYIKGVMIGSKIPDEEEESEVKKQMEAKESEEQLPAPYGFKTSNVFKTSLSKLYEDLLMEFTVKGADTDKFLAEKRRERQAAASSTRAI
jgi:ubiquitin-conjugating enzyme E2 O